eukprot:597085-Amphidinium_carterae.2
MQCMISDEEVLAVAAQQALAEVRSRLRSGSWLSSLEDDRRRVITQWINIILSGIEHTGLGRQLATNIGDRGAFWPKATTTIKKRLVYLNQYANMRYSSIWLMEWIRWHLPRPGCTLGLSWTHLRSRGDFVHM